ncbi:ABC transporter ATP-binding protein [Marinobacter sp. M3C]|uniref:ABC transporter ATP-binding protein n=1 Tax=Marinobacter sp. M3C TaxID=2917715 RepID=UPI00200E4BDF|nr:ABC transporter ATP-binding protein [Marinobacter sp. M3C]UQG60146.1 ABC transporter ATP-binding protein [Marinobacter sp. M3C]
MSLLTVEHVSKSFREYASEWKRVARWFGLPFKPVAENPILRDISFSIERGEAIGILGQNGAGKSTLLKLITGTLMPTAGIITVNGRIAAILELGMGFNPELTGRQNVYHAASIMGFSHAEVDNFMPAVEAFADIGEYFDEPVRVYSSGMQVRVAFAVATAVRPDILIIDEALSVGDAAFQRKCFRRINEFLEQGTTLLFVTHDIDAVKKLCKRAIFLHYGKIEAYGAAKEVCDAYEKSLFGGGTPAAEELTEGRQLDPTLASDCEVSYGDGRATIESIWLQNQSGEPVNLFNSGEPLVLKACVRFNQAVDHAVFAIMIKTREGLGLFGTDTSELAQFSGRTFQEGELVTLRYDIGNAFAPGVYYINCGVRDDRSNEPVFLHRRLDAVLFRVRSDENTTVKSGLINVPAKITIEETGT